MAHDVYWLIEDTLLFEYYSGELTAADVSTAQPQVVAMLDNTPAAQVHILVDVTGIEHVSLTPMQMLKVQSLKDAIQHHKAGQIVVVVDENPLHKFFLRLLVGLRNNITLRNSTTEALDYLAHFTTIPADVRARLMA